MPDKSKFHIVDEDEMDLEDAAQAPSLLTLKKAVAYYLYEESKGVPDGEAGLFRAAALALIGMPVDGTLLREAGNRQSNDDPLYSDDLFTEPSLIEMWLERHSN